MKGGTYRRPDRIMVVSLSAGKCELNISLVETWWRFLGDFFSKVVQCVRSVAGLVEGYR